MKPKKAVRNGLVLSSKDQPNHIDRDIVKPQSDQKASIVVESNLVPETFQVVSLPRDGKESKLQKQEALASAKIRAIEKRL